MAQRLGDPAKTHKVSRNMQQSGLASHHVHRSLEIQPPRQKRCAGGFLTRTGEEEQVTCSQSAPPGQTQRTEARAPVALGEHPAADHLQRAGLTSSLSLEVPQIAVTQRVFRGQARQLPELRKLRVVTQKCATTPTRVWVVSAANLQ